MSPTISAGLNLLAAANLQPFRIQLPETIVNWLTPLWILGVGAILGLLICLVLALVGKGLSKVPVLGNMDRHFSSQWGAIAFLTVAIAGLIFAIFGTEASVPAEALADGQQAIGGVAIWESVGKVALAFFMAMGIASLWSLRTQSELQDSIREGVLLPLTATCIGLAVFGLFGITIVRDPGALLENLTRYTELASQGEVTKSYEIAAPSNDTAEPPEVEIDVNFRSSEIQSVSFEGNQRVKVSSVPFDKPTLTSIIFDVIPGEKPTDKAGLWRRSPEGVLPFVTGDNTKMYVKNYGTAPATLTAKFVSRIANPEMLLVPRFAIFIVCVFLAYLIQRTLFPKLAAVAHATAKSDVASPTYAILLGLGVFALAVFVFIPYNTFGEDIKMLKDSGLTLILVFGIIQAVWAASQSVSVEIEGKTALTVLSKPIARRDFILGKFFGIGWSAGMMICILGLVLMVCVAYKPIYDAREGSMDNPTWQLCTHEMVQVIPGLFLAFLEILVMAAISVAISTRLPMVPNFILCFTIYVLGHLTPLLVQSQDVANNAEAVVFMGKMLATVLPVLDHFNIQAGISAGKEVPTHYLLVVTAYCMLYSSIAMLLALVLFEDRDLA